MNAFDAVRFLLFETTNVYAVLPAIEAFVASFGLDHVPKLIKTSIERMS